MRRTNTIIYLIILLAVAAMMARQPEYNWDMLPYMGLVLQLENPHMSNPEPIHTQTYAIAKRELPDAKFRLLTDSANIYRRRTYRESGTFLAELRYYSLKPLYIYAIRGFHMLGAPLPLATVLPSILSFVGIAILLLIWIRRLLPEPFATLMALPLVMAPFFLQSARASTPDLMAAFFALAGVYLLIERRAHLIGLPLLFAAALVRVDAVLFVIAIILYLLIMRLLPVKWGIASLAVIAIAAVAVLVRSPATIEELLVVRSAAERIVEPEIGSFIGAYLKGLKGSLGSIIYSSIALLLGVAVATFYMRTSKIGTSGRDPVITLLVMVVIHIAVRFILHPSIEDRFLLADYAIIAICALVTVRDLLYGVRRSPWTAISA